MGNEVKKQEKKLLLRLPAKTWEKVWKRACSQSRSINGQITYELDQKP